MVLSLLSLFLCGVSLLLGYSGLSPWWGALIMWLMSPPLLLFTLAYVVADLLKPSTRKQALIALSLAIPVAVVVWHFRFTGI